MDRWHQAAFEPLRQPSDFEAIRRLPARPPVTIHPMQAHHPAILFPMFALAGWTFLILLLIAITRIHAGLCGRIVPDDFRLGESAAVPERVRLPNRNYMNLLELPMLFYVVCLLLYVTGQHSATTLGLAWAYVGLRVLHSLIHLTYNHVLHRLAAFALSNAAVIAMWVLAGLGVASGAGA